MGRRRRRAVKQAKAKPKLDTQFDCPWCGNSKSVEVKMNRPDSLGVLKCRVCGVNYSTRINYLNEPVDVYSEWVDSAAENQKTIDARERSKSATVKGGLTNGPGPSSSSDNVRNVLAGQQLQQQKAGTGLAGKLPTMDARGSESGAGLEEGQDQGNGKAPVPSDSDDFLDDDDLGDDDLLK